MYILEKYYLIDDNGIEHELKCKVQSDINLLGREDELDANKEIRKIRDKELLAELSLMGVQ